MAQNEQLVERTLELSSLHIVPNSLNDLTEGEIWQKFKSGDEAAFIWIYREYFDKLFCFARQ